MSAQPITRSLPTETILVQGASGNVGYAILSALLSPHLPHMMPINLRAGIRDLSKLDKVMILGPQIEVVQLDTQFPQSVCFLCTPTSLTLAGTRCNAGGHQARYLPTQLRRQSRGNKIVNTSSHGCICAAYFAHICYWGCVAFRSLVITELIAADKSTTTNQKQFHSIEQFLERSGVGFTILRCALFMEDFHWFASQLTKGKLLLPLHSGSSAMVALRGKRNFIYPRSNIILRCG